MGLRNGGSSGRQPECEQRTTNSDVCDDDADDDDTATSTCQSSGPDSRTLAFFPRGKSVKLSVQASWFIVPIRLERVQRQRRHL